MFKFVLFLVILCVILLPVQSLDKIHKKHKNHFKTHTRDSNKVHFKLHQHARAHAQVRGGGNGEVSADNTEIKSGEQMIREGEQIQSQGEHMVNQGANDIEHTEASGTGGGNGFRNCQNSRTVVPQVQSNGWRCWAATGAVFKTAMGTPTTEQQFLDALVNAGGSIVPDGATKDGLPLTDDNYAKYAATAGATDVLMSITFQTLCDWLNSGPLIQFYQTGQTSSHVVLIVRAQGTNDDDFQIGYIDPADGTEQLKTLADFRTQYSDADFGKLYKPA